MLLIASFALGEDNGLRERFLQAYRPHAKRIRDSYTNVHLKYHFFQDHGDGKSSGWYLDAKLKDFNYLLEGESVTIDNRTKQVLNRGKRSITSQNPLYTFELDPADKGEYVVRKLDIHGERKPARLLVLSAPYADVLKLQTYLEIAQDDTNHIISFEDCIWQTKPAKVLKAQFSYIDPQTKKLTVSPYVNEYFFSPEEGWVCCGRKLYAIDGSKASAYEDRYYYEARSGEELPALKRIEEWYVYPQEPAKTKLAVTTEISEFQRSPVPFPDADFRLSAFGLPEPMGSQPPERPRTWIWLIAATVAAAALAILFAWLKRRRARMAPAKTSMPADRSVS
jgi:hypothetical protein